jgi:hypothetical protein
MVYQYENRPSLTVSDGDVRAWELIVCEVAGNLKEGRGHFTED